MAGFVDAIKIRGRSGKPRSRGLTFISDHGPTGAGWMGRRSAIDLLEIAAPYIDAAKIRVGYHFLLPQDWVVERIALHKEYDIVPYAGGILSEVAVLQDKVDEMLQGAVELGYPAIEISENLVTLDAGQRESFIKRTQDRGVKVIFEWGRKYPDRQLDLVQAVDEIG